jgi:hypothetical protein
MEKAPAMAAAGTGSGARESAAAAAGWVGFFRRGERRDERWSGGARNKRVPYLKEASQFQGNK